MKKEKTWRERERERERDPQMSALASPFDARYYLSRFVALSHEEDPHHDVFPRLNKIHMLYGHPDLRNIYCYVSLL